MNCFFSTCLLIFATQAMFAQSLAPITGVIGNDMRWSGAVFITGDVTVAAGATLEIEPGTQIFIRPREDGEQGGKQPDRIEITVLGSLMARGTHGEGQIVFTSAASVPQMHDWYGIIFQSRRQTSLLKNVVIEYAYTGVTCYGSSPQIENCTVQYNYFAGINCLVRARPLIRSSMILGNGFAGINVELAAAPVIENCIISQNANGVVIYDQGRPDLGQSAPGDGASRGGNHLSGNFDYDIYNRSRNDILAQNNYWSSDDISEIQRKIFDRRQDGQYGEVVFTPVLAVDFPALFAAAAPPAEPRRVATTVPPTTQRTPVSRPSDTAAGAQNSRSAGQRANNPVAQAAPEKPGNRPPTTPPVSSRTTPAETSPAETTAVETASAGTAPVETSSTEAESTGKGVDAPPANAETQPQPPPNSRPVGATLSDDRPIIEALLDGRRRQYLQRPTPEYPYSYQKVGIEGTVIVEVTVGQDGRVRDYRILRSDGEAFSDEVAKVIRNFRYKPGTVNGKPVHFKVIERFEFRLKERGN